MHNDSLKFLEEYELRIMRATLGRAIGACHNHQDTVSLAHALHHWGLFARYPLHRQSPLRSMTSPRASAAQPGTSSPQPGTSTAQAFCGCSKALWDFA